MNRKLAGLFLILVVSGVIAAAVYMLLRQRESSGAFYRRSRAANGRA